MLRFFHGLDYTILIIVFILLSLGFIILNSASAYLGQTRFDDSFYFVKHQALFGLTLGGILFFIALCTPYTFWKKVSLIGLVVTFILLIFVFIPPIGNEIKKVNRWVSLGPLTFQPSELLKLTLVMYLATVFDKKQWLASSFTRGVIPFATLLSIIGVLIIAQPDAGTLIIVGITAFLLYIFAGAKISHIGLLLLIGISIVSALIVLEPYRYDRIKTFLEPTIDPSGISYQITKSVLFIGSGSAFGTGLGQNPSQYKTLPEAMSDSIFAVAANELGFIGASFIILMFLILMIRGFTIAKNAPDLFGKLTALGITSFIVIQSFVNIGAISGVLPLTGIPLPLISYGGSSMMVVLFSLGILLNISKKAKISHYAKI